MGKCFSVKIVETYPTYKSQKSKYGDGEVHTSSTSTRAYEVIDKEALQSYKVSVASRNSSHQSLVNKDNSIHNSESYQNLRKKFFEDTR